MPFADTIEYTPPPGKVDFPFIYCYDSSSLADGQNLQNIQVQLQGDSEFILRRIVGVPNVVAATTSGGRFNFRNANTSYPNNVPQTGMALPVNYPTQPEKSYPLGSSIFIDLYDTLRAFNACGGTPIYTSQVAFIGVKRFDAASPYAQHVTTGKFKRKPQTYSFPLTISNAHFVSAGVVTNPIQYSQLVTNYDFELYGLRIAQPANVSPLQTQDFQIRLYDRGFHATSNVPVNQGYMNSARVTPQTAPQYRGIFPCPILIYPQGSQIVFDVLSMLCSTSLPQSYTISFVGAWRMPC